MLNSKELKEFRWTVEEYIKYGEINAITQEWTKELENASAKVHIERLEAIKLQMQNQIEVTYGNIEDGLSTMLGEIYKNTFYHTGYEIQKGLNVGSSMALIDDNKVQKAIRKPWGVDKNNFSSRLWSNKQKLINTLNTNLTQSIIRGEDPSKAINQISKVMGTAKSNVGRLVMTESAFIASAAQKDCFTELNVKQYEIVSTLDTKTSEVCRELDGKVFDMKDYQAGVTAPPFHPYCRTTTCPYFNDEFTQGEERAYKDAEGKTQYVKDMKYDEWYEKYVANINGGTGARTTSEWIKRDDIAENYYNIIRGRHDDVTKISKNTGIKKEEIQEVKEHVFYNTHIFDNGVGKFDANYDMAISWQRLINGSFEDRDIVLINHELLESKVEREYNLTYREAHEIAEKKYAWDKIIDDLFGGDGENDSLDELIKKE